VRLVDLREVVRQLKRVAEALRHQPVHGPELPEVAHEDEGEAAVAVDLGDALDAEAGGDVRGVVAEGLETLMQYRGVAALGCEASQGFYFARPMPAGGIDDLLERDGELSRVRLPVAAG